MQVKIKQEVPAFKPVTLEITFYNLEDARMIEAMLAYNVSVPNVVYQSQDKRNKLQELMRQIREPLTEQLKKDMQCK